MLDCCNVRRIGLRGRPGRGIRMKTYSTKMTEVTHAWHVLDATDQPLGRLASEAAALLRGKHKPVFQPNLPVGDFVVIVNAEKVKVTGNKEEGKLYYRHSQY